LATAEAQLTTAQAQVPATKLSNEKALQAAQAQLATAEAQLTTAQAQVPATKISNEKALQQAQGQVTAAQAQVSQAEVAVASAQDGNAKGTQQAQAQVVAAEAQVASAQDSAASTQAGNVKATQQAQAQVASAQLALSQDRSDLATDQADVGVSGGGGSSGGGGGSSPTYTDLPAVGQVISRGQTLFAVNGEPALLLYGYVTPWRAFMPGIPPGADVGALNANLEALGYGKDLGGDNFTAATEAAVKRLQSAHGLPVTGQLPLGSVLFQPSAVAVNAITPNLGSAATAGQTVLEVTLTARQVQIQLDASEQSDVQTGDKVSIVMPNNSTTPGVVTYVGTVASNPSGGNGPVIPVNVTPLDPAATGTLDQLPVNVWITEGSVNNAWVVPVDALVALAGGGYALEYVGGGGVHHLEAVSLGLFDDADGLVQVTGAGLYNGQRIVVPNV
jgi:multidrug efflux pump subunit AcrA (membrane-fusion protein)